MCETKEISIPSISNDGEGESVFSERKVEMMGSSERFLSEQIPALNFRMRASDSSYASGWHVSGDPTLLVILSGALRIGLRNGKTRDFSAGDMFVAEDYLKQDKLFDPDLHGHRAEVLGDTSLSAIHIKLNKR